MADDLLTNPRPDLRTDPAYIAARIRAAYHYLGETPTESDLQYWAGHVMENGDGWSGYWWDKMINGRPGVNLEPVPYDTVSYPVPGIPFPIGEPSYVARLDAKLDAMKAQSDANTAKIQQQIDQAIKNFEQSATPFAKILLGLGK